MGPVIRGVRLSLIAFLIFAAGAAAASLASKEAELKKDLFTLRTAIDEYTFDRQQAPQTLDDLVQAHYLREIPVDPMTGSSQTWLIVIEDSDTAVNQSQPGILDVKSGSRKKSSQASLYSEW